MKLRTEIRHIVIVAPSNSTLLDVAGPLDVFTKAIENYNSINDNIDFVYKTHVVSTTANKLVSMSSGISIMSDGFYKLIDYNIDTLIIAGLPKIQDYKMENDLLKWIKEQSKIVRRICSVCSGAFILAEADVLSGKNATTHWKYCGTLSNMYPAVKVDINPIFIKDGNVYTSAGVTAGMDLALALVEEDLGKSFAIEIAKDMVLFLKRPGNQSQYSTMLKYQNIDYKPIEKIKDWISDHLTEELTVERLAKESLMSPRNFARIFVRELKITPAKYIERLRIETACRFLEETQLNIEEIAAICGLKSSENMRRLFFKSLEINPSLYRSNFQR
ncbi:DJ-1/PfpI family protein [uncultured Bacteroides sp.]|uniref:GlxA family transcriptional regulator n=1 Tax=uncultured Bacteroides sp. TaxID=162156 RepID=UPI002AA783F2|nr:DJ-1/PfpI family protein [uncultured Bacteroides sp.]